MTTEVSDAVSARLAALDALFVKPKRVYSRDSPLRRRMGYALGMLAALGEGMRGVAERGDTGRF